MHSTSVGRAEAGTSAGKLLTPGLLLEVVVEAVVVLGEGRRAELELLTLSLVCSSPGVPLPHPATSRSAHEVRPTAAHRVAAEGGR